MERYEMGEKEYKQVSNKDKKKKHKKYRDIKCTGYDCNTTIDIDLCIDNDDIDYVDLKKTSIYIYCPKCGLQHEFKL